MLDVIIVGAGAAGVAAAKILKSKGLRFKILEARSRVGGRAHTLGSSFPIELGPEFIHGRAPRLTQLLKETGLNAFDVPDLHHERLGNRLIESEMWDVLDSTLKKFSTKAPDYSVDEALAKALKISAHDRSLTRAFVQGFDAALVREVSAHEIAKTRSQVIDPEERKSGRTFEGYSQFFEKLTVNLKGTIELNAAVEKIEWKAGSVKVSCSGRYKSSRSRTRSARAALITVPVGVLKSRPSEKGHIQFLPEIHQKASALRYLAMGPVEKIILQFKHDFWTEKLKRPVAMFHTPKNKYQTAWTAAPMRWPMITLWSGGDPALWLSQLKVSERIEIALQELSRTLRVGLPQLKKFLVKAHAHDWTVDPYSRGAYSFVKVGGQEAREQLAQSIEQTLFFAGEATSREQNGTLEGGIESGEREAKKILRLFD